MRIADILDAAELPLAHTPDYRATLTTQFSRYDKMLGELTTEDPLSLAVHEHREHSRVAAAALLEAFDASHSGDHPGGIAALARATASLDKWLPRLTSKQIEATTVTPLYRVRRGAASDPIGLGGIFHLDAEHAHLASASRYSLHRVPSLYLSRALFTAWRETGEPDQNACWISRFALRDGASFRVLDIGYTPELIADMVRRACVDQQRRLTPTGEFVVAYMLAWPLIAACSARRADGPGPHPEYVLPQLLLEWVASGEDFIGIRYFSTRAIESESGLFKQNYVFPAKRMGSRGYSPVLCDALRLTEPLQWSVAVTRGHGLGKPSQHDTRFRDVDGLVRRYHDTAYAQAEVYLEQQPLLTLSPTP